MSTETTVALHYTHGGLEDAIRAALTAAGKDPANLAPGDLAPVDEFHVGGHEATEHFAKTLKIAPGMKLLDIGCGIGGAARHFAATAGAQVCGIDLTEEYVAVATSLANCVGLSEQVAFRQASALDIPFDADTFDGATMLHVGMNIADKARLFAEAARVVKPGGQMGIYDIMRTGEGALEFPVPWAADETTSFLATAGDYRAALAAAGFEVIAEENRRDFAVAFFDKLSARMRKTGGPPPLGLHILMGAEAPAKIANMVRNITVGLMAPVEIVARKTG
ncbi:MAG: methyltransferase domain-containing protein [Alphaproteobacteria bacterium]|nr:methyltransferase domain-containing protein [Alphaproteobacteria bacterium]